MNNFLKVSIVVCTYSHERYFDTIETIESLVKQSYQNIEIILVVDRNLNLFNDFIDSDFLKSLTDFKISFSNLLGLSNARNKGVELSSGDVIAFIDDDAIADRDWISHLIICYKNPKVIGVGGPMKPLWISGRVTWIPEEFYWTMGCSYKSQKNTIHSVRSNFGSNMSFRHAIFEEVGYFDDEFGLVGDKMRTGEETEFSIRALNKFNDSKIMYVPDAVVFHKIYKFRKSFAFLLKRCYGYGYAIANIGRSKKSIDDKLESTESNFLTHLLKSSFPERLKNIIFLKDVYTSILNSIALVMFCTAVFAGFVCGNITSVVLSQNYFADSKTFKSSIHDTITGDEKD